MRCQGNRLSRRNFLTVGAVGGLGLTLANFLELRHAQAEQKHYDFIEAKADSVIHVFLPGGIAHQESFDPKPYSPIEYRGEMGSIKTNTGEVVSETIPQLAKIADRYAIIRSMTHGEAAHERGTHNMFTGYKPSPALQYPSFGSVISHEYGPENNLPPYVCIPNQPNIYAGSGYLSSSFAPFSLGADPASGGFKVRDLSLPGGVTDERFARRRSALEAVNYYFTQRDKSDNVGAMNTFYERAYSMISSPQAREAFDIEKEDPKLRDRYGRNEAGQRMLMARRLVEAGVRMVTLTYGGWDMHNGITPGMRSQMPALDQALATLLLDLEERGLAQADAGDGVQRVRTHAQDQPDRRPRPLAEGVQRPVGRRRHQGRDDPRHVRCDGFRAGTRSGQPGRPGDHDVLSVGHHRRQGVDGSRRSAHRNCRRRPVDQAVDQLAYCQRLAEGPRVRTFGRRR